MIHRLSPRATKRDRGAAIALKHQHLSILQFV